MLPSELPVSVFGPHTRAGPTPSQGTTVSSSLAEGHLQPVTPTSHQPTFQGELGRCQHIFREPFPTKRRGSRLIRPPSGSTGARPNSRQQAWGTAGTGQTAEPRHPDHLPCETSLLGPLLGLGFPTRCVTLMMKSTFRTKSPVQCPHNDGRTVGAHMCVPYSWPPWLIQGRPGSSEGVSTPARPCVWPYRGPHTGRTCFWNERDDFRAGRGGSLPPPTAHGREA